jgi:hypothetical protein
MSTNFLESRLSKGLEVIVFEANIPLVAKAGDLTPLQRYWLIGAHSRRVEELQEAMRQ